ncbi:hypothetical protein ARB_00513 [Paecilomyces variotii No. 5]|uniref:Uncharacterized protein n=1 Tax=Byssochlamys spectabilis (strain No. 5 / NBRC 109023) TaxID=1356009 RepID=V5G8G8_BYSSN|nr:hypothetical protein ARB_00513 [Paecilomyces variotii No. 5]
MESSSVQKQAENAATRGDVAALRQCFRDGASPLDKKVNLRALSRGDIELFQVIVDAGGDVNLNMGYVGTPLISALQRKRDAFLEFLFSRSVDPNVGSLGHHLPPISVAVRFNRTTRWVQTLLERGATLSNTGALHIAAFLGQVDQMELLLRFGADPNEIPRPQPIAIVDYRREGTAMHWAIAGGHLEAIQLLLAQNPDLDALDADGISVQTRLDQFWTAKRY